MKVTALGRHLQTQKKTGLKCIELLKYASVVEFINMSGLH